MRKLTLNAAMRAAAILRQTGLDDKLKKTLRDSKGEISNENAFDMLVDVVTSCAVDAPEETAGLLGYLFEMESGEVLEMPIKEFADKLRELAGENDLEFFFTAAFTSATQR